MRWISAEEGRVEKKRRRPNSFRSNQNPALRGSSLDVSISGEHSSQVLCKKERNWLIDNSEAPDLDTVHPDTSSTTPEMSNP